MVACRREHDDNAGFFHTALATLPFKKLYVGKEAEKEEGEEEEEEEEEEDGDHLYTVKGRRQRRRKRRRRGGGDRREGTVAKALHGQRFPMPL